METRRGFLKKAVYLSPVILTAAVHPAFAAGAYGRPGDDDDDDDDDGGRGDADRRRGDDDGGRRREGDD